MFPLLGEGDVMAVSVWLVWEVGERGVVRLCVATLSLGAWRLGAVVILRVWVCPYYLCRCWSSCASLSRRHPRGGAVQKGLAA